MGGQGKSGQRKQEKLCYELTIVYLTYITLKCLSEANCVNYVIDFKCTQKWWSLTTFLKSYALTYLLTLYKYKVFNLRLKKI